VAWLKLARFAFAVNAAKKVPGQAHNLKVARVRNLRPGLWPGLRFFFQTPEPCCLSSYYFLLTPYSNYSGGIGPKNARFVALRQANRQSSKRAAKSLASADPMASSE
jgi:hypothetical protein